MENAVTSQVLSVAVNQDGRADLQESVKLETVSAINSGPSAGVNVNSTNAECNGSTGTFFFISTYYVFFVF